MRTLIPIILITLVVSGCGNSSSGPDAQAGEFSGTWNVKYNLTFDSCGLYPQDVTGFDDVFLVAQDTSDLVLQTGAGQGNELAGALQDDLSAQFSATGQSQPFGDGTNCAVNLQISYQGTDNDKVNTVFFEQFNCSNGSSCEFRAIGTGVRE